MHLAANTELIVLSRCLAELLLGDKLLPLPSQFISVLPARVLRLLEFVGFSGNRELGLEQLTLGGESDTFRAPFCVSSLLVYYTVGSVMIGEYPVHPVPCPGLVPICL